MTFFTCNALKCISMSNQEYKKARPVIMNINIDEPSIYLSSILLNKCSGSCNDINDSYAKLCVPDVVKNINVKVFNLMLRANERRHIEWYETCKCKCRLDANICNNKQRQNKGKRGCEYKEMIDKGICHKGFIWNPSNWECECDKSFDLREYFHYKNCKCKKRLTNKLVEECSENINNNEMVDNGNDHKKVYNFGTIYIVLYVIAFLIIIGIRSAYFH